jgi:hypothetical protein
MRQPISCLHCIYYDLYQITPHCSSSTAVNVNGCSSLMWPFGVGLHITQQRTLLQHFPDSNILTFSTMSHCSSLRLLILRSPQVYHHGLWWPWSQSCSSPHHVQLSWHLHSLWSQGLTEGLVKCVLTTPRILLRLHFPPVSFRMTGPLHLIASSLQWPWAGGRHLLSGTHAHDFSPMLLSSVLTTPLPLHHSPFLDQQNRPS